MVVQVSHDPLCESRNVDGFPCYTCALIARVRADERTGPLNMRSFDAGYALALRDAVEMAREKHFAVMEHGKQSCAVHGCDGCHLSSYLGEVIAAIEDLLERSV